ncbi:Lipoprotein signal peptidase [Minicystis rosea]|nr:Lipoprotein signal peptidase [Minicystis rosea]
MHQDPGPVEPTALDTSPAPSVEPDPLAADRRAEDPAAGPGVDLTLAAGAPPVDQAAFTGADAPVASPIGEASRGPSSARLPFGLGPVPPPSQSAGTVFLVVVTTVSLAADLVTKGWAKGKLSGFDAKIHAPKRFEVWKNHLDFIFAQNPGGAWSFLRGLPDTLRRPFFLVVSAAAIVFIISIYQRVHRDQTAMRWGLPLALGGAMGNLVDRMRYGWVVDFIDFSMRWGGRDHHWPTFNVADIAIVVGVALMGIDMLRARRVLESPEAAPAVAPPVV